MSNVVSHILNSERKNPQKNLLTFRYDNPILNQYFLKTNSYLWLTEQDSDYIPSIQFFTSFKQIPIDIDLSAVLIHDPKYFEAGKYVSNSLHIPLGFINTSYIDYQTFETYINSFMEKIRGYNHKFIRS